MLQQLARGGLIKGKTIGVDSTTLEANAAMKSIVRRDKQESYTAYLQRLVAAEGIGVEDAAAVRRMDRKCSAAELISEKTPEGEYQVSSGGRRGSGRRQGANVCWRTCFTLSVCSIPW